MDDVGKIRHELYMDLQSLHEPCSREAGVVNSIEAMIEAKFKELMDKQTKEKEDE